MVALMKNPAANQGWLHCSRCVEISFTVAVALKLVDADSSPTCSHATFRIFDMTFGRSLVTFPTEDKDSVCSATLEGGEYGEGIGCHYEALSWRKSVRCRRSDHVWFCGGICRVVRPRHRNHMPASCVASLITAHDDFDWDITTIDEADRLTVAIC